MTLPGCTGVAGETLSPQALTRLTGKDKLAECAHFQCSVNPLCLTSENIHLSHTASHVK